MDLLASDRIEVGAFWQVPSDQAICILIGSSLPGGVRMGEIAFNPDVGGHLLMPGVFGAVVHGQGSSGFRRKAS